MIGIIDFIANALILCLFFRFVATKKHYWVRGGLMTGILHLTDSLVRPFYQQFREYSTLICIAIICLVRAAFFVLLVSSSPIPALCGSLLMFINFSAQTLFLFFCFSLLLSRHGLVGTRNIFIEFIHDVAFDCFRLVRLVLRTENLFILFLGAVVLLTAVHGSLVYSILAGAMSVSKVLASTLLLFVNSLGFFMVLLFFYALISWFNPDPYSEPMQILTALVAPFVETVRRYLPWTRVGLLDLSVLVALFGIYVAQSLLTQIILAVMGTG